MQKTEHCWTIDLLLANWQRLMMNENMCEFGEHKPDNALQQIHSSTSSVWQSGNNVIFTALYKAWLLDLFDMRGTAR